MDSRPRPQPANKLPCGLLGTLLMHGPTPVLERPRLFSEENPSLEPAAKRFKPSLFSCRWSNPSTTTATGEDSVSACSGSASHPTADPLKSALQSLRDKSSDVSASLNFSPTLTACTVAPDLIDDSISVRSYHELESISESEEHNHHLLSSTKP